MQTPANQLKLESTAAKAAAGFHTPEVEPKERGASGRQLRRNS